MSEYPLCNGKKPRYQVMVGLVWYGLYPRNGVAIYDVVSANGSHAGATWKDPIRNQWYGQKSEDILLGPFPTVRQAAWELGRRDRATHGVE